MNMTEPETYGTLYIIATPIGNLEDITLRALRLLKEVDYIAAEDTRHTKKLLNHYGIHTKLISYYREKEHQRADYILSLLQQGKNIGLVTDAGTPGVSDPGAIVVQKAVAQEIHVVPIPGPSALTTALSCAGIEQGPVLFLGFAPPKKNQRKAVLQTLVHADHYTVFYESPHRFSSFVTDAYDILGDRSLFIGRELTKNFEELTHTSLKHLIEEAAGSNKKHKGEFVIIIAPAASRPSQEMNMDELIIWYRDNSTLSMKDCCKTLASDLGISKSEIYKRAIELWKTEKQ